MAFIQTHAKRRRDAVVHVLRAYVLDLALAMEPPIRECQRWRILGSRCKVPPLMPGCAFVVGCGDDGVPRNI